jgi:two-component system, LytTR family, sensor kinase
MQAQSEQPVEARPSRWKSWLAVIGGFCALSVFDATSTVLSYSYGPAPIRFRTALLYATTNWYIWALLAVPIVLVARRVSLERGQRLRGILILAAFGVLVAIARVWLYGVITEYLYASSPGPLARRVPREGPANFLTYGVLLLAFYMLRYYRLYRERELRASMLETGLAQARLEALRMQLHPHFLFNTLNSISTLMHRDVSAADDMLSALSDLLRVALDRSGGQEITLKEELDFLQRYLEIEQIRFGDRLQIRYEIDAACLDAMVPNLILQPLVENAIRHGINPRPEPGQVEIAAWKEGGELFLEVSDDGPGLPAGSSLKEGVGLGNTRDRLEQLYGNTNTLQLNSSTHGLTVLVTIPFHTA